MTLLTYLRNDLLLDDHAVRDFARGILPDHISHEYDYEQLARFFRQLRRFNLRNHGGFIYDLMSNADLDECGDCDSIMSMCDSYSVNHGDNHVCQSCCDENYYYSEHGDTYRHNDEYDEYEGYDEYTGTYSYDTNVLDYCGFNKLPNENASQFYGIELEVERRKDCPSDIADDINRMYGGFAICKSDGSLDNGFEIVTGPSTIGYHKLKWEEFFNSKTCQENLKGWNTDTAGLHIHIGRKHLTPLNIGKILVFINDNSNYHFINDIAGRSSDQWARKSPKKVSDVMRPTGEKYEAVNTNHHATIELRIFRSNITRHGFYRVLEFTDAMVNFVKQTNCTTTSLHYTAFCRYVAREQQRSQYPNLLAWLIRKGYVKDVKPSRIVVDTEEETVTNQVG